MSAEDRFEIVDACEALRKPLMAFSVFMELVKDGDALNGQMIYCLLEPIENAMCEGIERLEAMGRQ